MKFKYIIIVLVVAAMSCGPKKGIVTKKKRTETKKTVVLKDTKQERQTDVIDKPVVLEKNHEMQLKFT